MNLRSGNFRIKFSIRIIIEVSEKKEKKSKRWRLPKDYSAISLRINQLGIHDLYNVPVKSIKYIEIKQEMRF